MTTRRQFRRARIWVVLLALFATATFAASPSANAQSTDTGLRDGTTVVLENVGRPGLNLITHSRINRLAMNTTTAERAQWLVGSDDRGTWLQNVETGGYLNARGTLWTNTVTKLSNRTAFEVDVLADGSITLQGVGDRYIGTRAGRGSWATQEPVALADDQWNVTVVHEAPGISIDADTVTLDGLPAGTAPGEHIDPGYAVLRFHIENTSDTVMANVQTQPQSSCNGKDLQPGQSLLCTGGINILMSTPNPGPISATANDGAFSAESQYFFDSEIVELIVSNLALNGQSAANPGPTLALGTADLTFTVENTGNVAHVLSTSADHPATHNPTPSTCDGVSLAPGETVDCSAVVEITDAGGLNQLTTVATGELSDTWYRQYWYYQPAMPAVLEIVSVEVDGQPADSAPGPQVTTGDRSVSIGVTNTGETMARGLVADGDITCDSTEVAPGAAVVCAGTLTTAVGTQSPIAVNLNADDGASVSAAVHVDVMASPGLVVINEVETKAGTTDWTELHNPGGTTIELEGYVLFDNNNRFTFTASHSIEPGGYLVLDRNQVGFGYGDDDRALLKDPNNNTVSIYSWRSHPSTSFGLCTNGNLLGRYQTTVTTTRGAENDCIDESDGVSSIDVTTRINGIDSDTAPGPALFPGTVTLMIDVTNTGTLSQQITTTPASHCDDGQWLQPGGTRQCEAQLDVSVDGVVDVPVSATASTFAADDVTATSQYSYTLALGEVVINEIVTVAGAQGDFVELYNPGWETSYLGGYELTDGVNSYTIADALLEPRQYLVLDQMNIDFASAGQVQLIDPAGNVASEFGWTTHAETSWGLCSGDVYAVNYSATPGTLNDCYAVPAFASWGGPQSWTVEDDADTFEEDLSGLDIVEYEGPWTASLWGANDSGFMYRYDASPGFSDWTVTSGWEDGRELRFPTGNERVDAEGVTFAADLSRIFIGSERMGSNNRSSVLRFDPTGTGEMRADMEWNLTHNASNAANTLPSTGTNLGIEGITWVPDAHLTSRGFVESDGSLYDPSNYPGNGGGLFFVSLEGPGTNVDPIWVFALMDNNGTPSFSRITSIDPELDRSVGLEYDADMGRLWAICDDGCQGRSSVMELSNVDGTFRVMELHERPGNPVNANPTTGNLDTEGFAIAPLWTCGSGPEWSRPVLFADDADTNSHSLRQGGIICDDD